MTRLLHLSDTHFGAEAPVVAQAALAAAHRLRPDVTIITGDITHRARAGQFRAASQFINQLPPCARLIMPGNHDLPLWNLAARLLAPYGNYHRAFGLREGVWCDAVSRKLAIVAFDTSCVWRHTRGKLSLQHAQRKLIRARGQLAPGGMLVACIHQPLTTALAQDRSQVLVNAAAVAQLMAEQQVDLLLSGHVHEPLIATSACAFAALPRHYVFSGAGAATASRTEPGATASFNVIEMEEAARRLSLIRHDFDAQLQQFVAQPAANFIDSKGGWRAHAG